MLTLRISHPQHGDKVVLLTKEDFQGEGVSIGRAVRSRVVLDDQMVSRQHARLTLAQGNVVIADCGSTAGMSLNGVRLAPHQGARVSDGDRFVIGPFTVEVLPNKQDDEDALGATIMAAPPMDSYMPLAGLVERDPPCWTGGELTVTVARIITETPDVKTFVLVAPRPTRFVYLPGQFITVQVLIEGTPTTRSYTISSSPSRPFTLSITVKHVQGAEGQPEGEASSWLHRRLAVGDSLVINGPFGDFSCVRHPSPRLLMISAGSGITPMLSMSRWLTDGAAEVDAVFLHSARTSTDLIGRADLELLAVHNPRLRVVLATTRPEPGSRWTGLNGRFSSALLKLTVPDFRQRVIFCCGPDGFMAGVKEIMAAEQFPMAHFHEESFGAPRRPSSPVTPVAPLALASIGTPTPLRVSEFGLKALLKAQTSPLGQVTPPLGHPALGSGQPSTQHLSSGTRTAVRPEILPSLHFTKSKLSLVCPVGQTVLEAGESKGVKLPFGCRMGKCGACKLVKRSGDLHPDGYDDSVLQSGDRAKGYVLACIARPMGRVEIDA